MFIEEEILALSNSDALLKSNIIVGEELMRLTAPFELISSTSEDIPPNVILE